MMCIVSWYLKFNTTLLCMCVCVYIIKLILPFFFLTKFLIMRLHTASLSALWMSSEEKIFVTEFEISHDSTSEAVH